MYICNQYIIFIPEIYKRSMSQKKFSALTIITTLFSSRHILQLQMKFIVLIKKMIAEEDITEL